jgi:hypothetical protein
MRDRDRVDDLVGLSAEANLVLEAFEEDLEEALEEALEEDGPAALSCELLTDDWAREDHAYYRRDMETAFMGEVARCFARFEEWRHFHVQTYREHLLEHEWDVAGPAGVKLSFPEKK